MQYIILIGQFPNDLEKKVNDNLSSGWILQGGVSVSRSRNKSGGGTDDLIYSQAMTKTNP